MPDTDLRQRVFKAADDEYLRRGSLAAVGYREIREAVRGASNEVRSLVAEWRKSREQMGRSRPPALNAFIEQFAATMWLTAQISASRTVQESPATGFPSAGTSRSAVSITAHNDFPAQTAEFVLLPERTPIPLSDADWSGARSEKMAKAVAALLRKRCERMRALAIYQALSPNNRPRDEAHATRDLKVALQGSRIIWAKGGWFWFEGEAVPTKRSTKRDSELATQFERGRILWDRIARSIAALGRPFTEDEVAAATVVEREGLGESWLRLRLIRARTGEARFIERKNDGILVWTGLDPASVVRNA